MNARCPSPIPYLFFDPHGPWSLWEMVNNFRYPAVAHVLFELNNLARTSYQNMKVVAARAALPQFGRMFPNEQDVMNECIDGANKMAELSEQLFSGLKSIHLDSAIGGLKRYCTNAAPEWAELNTRVRSLRDGIRNELRQYIYYQYPKERGLKLQNWKTDWESAVTAFPAIEREVFEATDCFALGKATASVFHSMRVAEHGLRALAAERRVKLAKSRPLEWATWQQILSRLQHEVTVIGGKRPSTARDEALAFYSGAVADLNGFKDEYRNLVMHVRASYDDLQAQRGLELVRAFMIRVAAKIDRSHKRIRWRF